MCSKLSWYAIVVDLLPVSFFFRFHLLKFKLAMTLLFAGLSGNILERAFNGYVTDFISFSNYKFNIADICILVGLITFFYYFKKELSARLPDGNRRSIFPKILDWEKKLLLKQVALYLIIILVLYFASLSYLNIGLSVFGVSNEYGKKEFLLPFTLIFFGTGLLLGTLFYIICFNLLKKISGPIRAFEIYLDKVLSGDEVSLDLREGDLFQSFAIKLKQVSKKPSHED